MFSVNSGKRNSRKALQKFINPETRRLAARDSQHSRRRCTARSLPVAMETCALQFSDESNAAGVHAHPLSPSSHGEKYMIKKTSGKRKTEFPLWAQMPEKTDPFRFTAFRCQTCFAAPSISFESTVVFSQNTTLFTWFASGYTRRFWKYFGAHTAL